MVQRVLLAGIALGPALAVLLVPGSALGAPATFALGGAGCLYSLGASFRRRGVRIATPDGPGFLLGAAGAADDLPRPECLRSELALRIAAPTPADCDREEAIRDVLTRVIWRLGHPGPEWLDAEQLRSVALLDRLLRASAPEAATLAQRFRQPAAVLDLRDCVCGLEAA